MADTEASPSTVVFRCGKTSYTDADVIHAAWFRGELQAPWNELIRRLDCEEAAGEADFDDDVVDAAVEQFRYDHDLITIEETEKWLEARGLTMEDFSAFFSRLFWGDKLRNEVNSTPRDYATESPELHAMLRTDLFLTDQFMPMANRFACRVACASKTPAENVDLAQGKADFLQRAGLTGENLPGALNALGRDQDWLEEMLRLEAGFNQQATALLTPQTRQRELAALRLALTRLSAEMLELDSQDAAREAALCVQMDGLTMEEVAQENGYPFKRVDLLVEDIPADMQQKFLSVHPGTVLDEIPRGDGFQLWRVIEKNEPAPDDAEVQSRIDTRILDRHFGKLVADQVQSMMPGSGAQ